MLGLHGRGLRILNHNDCFVDFFVEGLRKARVGHSSI